MIGPRVPAWRARGGSDMVACRTWILALVVLLGGATASVVVAQGTKPAAKPTAAAPSPGAGPVIVVETVKGTFEFETYPEEAPKTIEQILRLVNKNFYTGLRIHRVEPGFVVQFGDPQTRDVSKRDLWGRGSASGSGKPVGVAEFSKKRGHVKGAVGLAHAGDATKGDSQMYIMLADRPALNGKYTVFGKVTSGMDVVAKLQVTDVIKKVHVK
jgi:cyclophilin family peptidyl-prolyl cis-trans isomerase